MSSTARTSSSAQCAGAQCLGATHRTKTSARAVVEPCIARTAAGPADARELDHPDDPMTVSGKGLQQLEHLLVGAIHRTGQGVDDVCADVGIAHRHCVRVAVGALPDLGRGPY